MSTPITINRYDRARSILHLSMAETDQCPAELELRLGRVKDRERLNRALQRHPQARLHARRRLLGTQCTVVFEGPTSGALALMREMNQLAR